ncbi:Small subunit (SSU) processome component [Coemansia sp. RSA 1200]|nr:Small subunit (SSU) processome component [Coemansia sp. RSA 1200]
MPRKTVHRKRTTDSATAAGKATRTKTRPSEDELDGNRWICAFDSGDSSLALVRSGVNGNKMRVIDVHTGTQRSEYSSESNNKSKSAAGAAAGAGKITAVAWGADGSKEKRQSAATGSGSGGSASKTPQVVALGLHSGSVLLYSPAWNAVVKELSGGHECPVADIAFVSEATNRDNSSSSNSNNNVGSSALFSLGTDGTVVHWDLQSGTQLSRLRTGVSGAGRLLVAAAAAPGASSSRRIVVASHRIEMWDLGSESRIQTWPGHTAPIHTLLWAADETALVSAAQNDRHVQVWDATAPASTAEPTSEAASSAAAASASASRACAVLAADSEVVYVDVSAAGSVLAVGQNGLLYAWHQVAVPHRASKTGGSKSKSGRSALGYPPDGMLKIVSSAAPSSAEDAGSSVLGIHVARFSRVTGDDEGTNVLVVRGSALKPLFETLSLAASDVSHLQFDPDLVIVRDPQDNLLIGSASALKTDAERQAAAQMHAYDESGANVTSLVNEGVRESQRAMEKGNSDDAQKGAPAAPVPTLADRIQQLSVGPTSGNADGAKKLQNLSAGTLIRVLVQSLHTADSALLETVLMNSARPTVVRDTVLGLPTAYVLPFLQQLFVRFQTNGGGGGSSPARAQQLLPWIRHTLALHSAYLTSIPSLVPQLAGFYQSLESRLESHQKLLRLSGRLELANMQIRARSHYEKERAKQERDAQKQTSMEPLNVYKEEEEEENDDDERSTVPPTPVWQAEESTDSEALSDDDVDDDDDDDASAMDDDAQWSDSDAEASSQNGGSSSSSDDDDDSGDDEAASDSSGDKIML